MDNNSSRDRSDISREKSTSKEVKSIVDAFNRIDNGSWTISFEVLSFIHRFNTNGRD